jgi:hypothetical protein
MPAFFAQRWTFEQPSPFGDVSSSYELTPEGLQFRSDAPMDPVCETLRWDAIAEAATAVVDLPAGKGGPDMARWIPGRLEWLLISRSGSNARAFMRPLPASETRDAIVAALRERLGSRWVGERLALPSAQKRFRICEGGDTLKVAGLVLSVLAVLLILLLLVAVASALFLIPAAVVFGGWLGHRGVDGLLDARRIADMPTAKVARAAAGPVKLEGRAVAERPSPAGVSGASSVWWDVAVDAWSDSDEGSGWNQVMARHGGRADMLVLEDETGRMPVWLRDADLLLQEHTWETGKQELPEGGVALLQGTAFAWNGRQRLRVRETRMEANAPVVVVGTLDQARNLPADGDERGLARLKRSLRSGRWRSTLVRWLPALLRAPVMVAIAYLDMLFGVGRGGERARQPGDAPRPTLGASATLVWKGRAGHALIVSDRRETEALAQLRRRSLWSVAIGGAICCWALYELVTMF